MLQKPISKSVSHTSELSAAHLKRAQGVDTSLQLGNATDHKEHAVEDQWATLGITWLTWGAGLLPMPSVTAEYLVWRIAVRDLKDGSH